ncbi:hypothetical protein R3P38DRAFT_2787546 [Favolaschia claudopus]|uniref:Uncharacterized protein n=1 Tax=Favolaschia claudopus TaxID=2862362 RepID=A0AAW0AQ63_9AGAR
MIPKFLSAFEVPARNHFSNGVHQVGKLVKHNCKASLSLFIPVDPKDLRIVIVPAPGAPHSHPAFPRTKIPLDVQQKYVGVAKKVRLSRRTTLGVDQAANEDSGGKLVQEVHPGMGNNRKRNAYATNCVLVGAIGVRVVDRPSGLIQAFAERLCY